MLQSSFRAKQQTYDYMRKSAWYKTTLPWVAQELEETRRRPAMFSMKCLRAASVGHQNLTESRH